MDVQIVSINEEGTNFELDEDALRSIFHKVRRRWAVCGKGS